MYASHSLLSVNDSPTTDTYTLSLHDALPISPVTTATCSFNGFRFASRMDTHLNGPASGLDHPAARIFASYRKRSEEHTSELQSRGHLVCRLLLEKKKKCICLMRQPLCTRH